MQISAEHYFHAALERIHQARLIYRAGDSYALAMYTSGLAVESMLRAFRWKKDQSFEGRHDLLRLFRESGLLQLNEEHLRAKGLSSDMVLQQVARFQGLMNHVVLVWTNDLRYAPEALVRSRIVRMRLYERRKGDVLKSTSLQLQNAAQEL
ncbi:MAG TPA: HEPN domain-containing protein, partial [Pirellulales bacterium]|nr:HEPN domain-containing protein [Pirellulales bacterium]